MKKTGTRKAGAGQKKGRVKVGKLKPNKETLKDLSGSTKKQLQGGGQLGGTFGGGGFSCARAPKV